MTAKKKPASKKKTTKKKVVKKRSTKKKQIKKKSSRKKAKKKSAKSKPNKPSPIIGNEFWKMRSSHGRNPIFKEPEELLKASYEYFEWVVSTPLVEAKPFAYEGRITMANVPKMRAMTLEGLCIFLDVSRKTWDNYHAKDDFLPVTSHIKDIIYNQKFTGAAANLLNSNIIARDLGLRDTLDNTISNPDGSNLTVGFYMPLNGREQEKPEDDKS